EQVVLATEVEQGTDIRTSNLAEGSRFVLQAHLRADGQAVSGRGLYDDGLTLVIRAQQRCDAVPFLEQAHDLIAAAGCSRLRAGSLTVARYGFHQTQIRGALFPMDRFNSSLIGDEKPGRVCLSEETVLVGFFNAVTRRYGPQRRNNRRFKLLPEQN